MFREKIGLLAVKRGWWGKQERTQQRWSGQTQGHWRGGRKNPWGLQTDWRLEECSKEKPRLAPDWIHEQFWSNLFRRLRQKRVSSAFQPPSHSSDRETLCLARDDNASMSTKSFSNASAARGDHITPFQPKRQRRATGKYFPFGIKKWTEPFEKNAC